MKQHKTTRPQSAWIVLKKRANEDLDSRPQGVDLQASSVTPGPITVSPASILHRQDFHLASSSFCLKGFHLLSQRTGLPGMNSVHFSESEKVFVSPLFSKFIFPRCIDTDGQFFLSVL